MVHRGKGRKLFFAIFSPPKVGQTILEIKNICLLLLTVFYVTQPSKTNYLVDFEKQNTTHY